MKNRNKNYRQDTVTALDKVVAKLKSTADEIERFNASLANDDVTTFQLKRKAMYHTQELSYHVIHRLYTIANYYSVQDALAEAEAMDEHDRYNDLLEDYDQDTD